MSESIEVSICIPTYNQTKYLVKTLNSIISQTFKSFEIIISDDSSTDDVADLITTYKEKILSIPIKYVRNNPSLGSPENWNHSIAMATGKWIKIMHHDDWFTNSDALIRMVEVAKIHPNSLIFAGIKGDVPKENRTYVNLPSVEVIQKIINDPFELVWGNFIGPPSTILFPNIKVQFDKKLIWLVDIEFYFNLLIKNDLKLIYIQEIYFENIMDAHNITNECFQNKQLELKEFNYIYNKYNKDKGILQRLKFLNRLKKHISMYSKVTWFELFKSNTQNQFR